MADFHSKRIPAHMNPAAAWVASLFARGVPTVTALVLLAAGGTRAGTITDDFSTSRDYLTAGVTGTLWDGIRNQSAANVLNTTGTAGELTIGAPSSAVGWQDTLSNAPYIYKNVTGDFDARVKVTGGTTVNYSIAGLLVRLDPANADGNAAEDFVMVTDNLFNGQNQLRSVNDNAQSDSGGYAGAAAYLRLTRVGSVFNAYTSSDGTTWTQRAWGGGDLNLTRADLGGTVQLGLTHGAFVTGNTTYARFDNFTLITPDAPTATLTWANEASDNWATGTWSGGPPTSPDSATPTIIDTPWTVTVDSSQAALSLDVSNDGMVSVTDTGTLAVGGATTLGTAGMLQIASGAGFTLPTISLAGGTLAISGTRTMTSSITLGAASTVSTPNSADSVTIGSALPGAAGLTKDGDGTLVLAMNNNSTFTGSTTINAGTLTVAEHFGIGGYNRTLNGPVVVNSGATLRWNWHDQLASAATLTVNGGTADLQGYEDYIGTLTLQNGGQLLGTGATNDSFVLIDGSAPKILGSGGGNAGNISAPVAITSQWANPPGARTLEFNVDAATTLTVSGKIIDTALRNATNTYAGSISKTGDGTLVLSGANTYSGDTTVAAGELVFNAPASGNCLTLGVKEWSNNRITGTGSATLNGPFYIDLSDASLASLTSHAWALVDVATKSYGTSFRITGTGGDWTLSSGVWSMIDGSKTWTFTQSTGVLAIGSGTGDYASWAITQGLSGGTGTALDPAFAADPNKDGIHNGMAWILGADALGNPAANLLMLPAATRDGTGALVLTFDRLASSAASVPLLVQYGDDLGATGWTAFAVGSAAGTTTDGNGVFITVAPGVGSSADYDRITVTIPATYTVAHPKTFARLRATSTVTITPPPIDDATVAKWSAPYRNWYYQPNHVISSTPNIPGYASFQGTDVPTVYQLPGDTAKWYMSFIAFNGNGYNSFVEESTDLVNWSNPRLAMGFGQPGAFDYGGCVVGAYLYESYDIKAPRMLKQRDGQYWTLYGAYPFQTGYESRPGYEGVASSAIGLAWQQAKPAPILSVYDPDCGAWEQSCIYQPWLVENNGTFYNFYNAANGGIEQSGVATSTDLLDWTRYPGNPVLKNANSSYDAGFASDPKVFRDGDHWTMFYFGVGAGGAHIMAAFSYDLMNWKASTVPLYLAGGNPSGLDSSFAHKISLVYNPQNDTYYLYYCAVGNAGRGIGLITSKPLPSTGGSGNEP